MPDKTYAEGLEAGKAEGRLLAMEHVIADLTTRHERLEGRVTTLEKMHYLLLGAIALVQFAPLIKGFLA